MSDVLPSTIKIKEQDVMKHREHHRNSFSSIRKQSISSLTSHQSLSLEQKRKLNQKNNHSNSNASKTHQKVADLESQISVMKQQHLDMLEALHKEIETLKTRNKGE